MNEIKYSDKIVKYSSFEILYRDENIVAVNKPYGYFVHRSKLDFQADLLILPILRDQIGQKIYPVHRLDRKTTGVLMFALNPYTQIYLNDLFAKGSIHKEYLAIVRGYTPEQGTIDYPLINDRGIKQEALTNFETILKTEIPLKSWQHPTSRYSLVLLRPKTGRQHQLRKHLAHIFHPIIGDRPHGCNKQNRFFLSHFDFSQMLLHASSISFTDQNGDTVEISARLHPEFERMKIALKFL
jgi:tRNA pseudouridine65 synthase